MENERILRQKEFSEFLAHVSAHAYQIEKPHPMYWSALVDGGFAISKKDGNENIYRLTDTGRRLQECGSYQKYVDEIANENYTQLIAINDEKDREDRQMFIMEQQYQLALKQAELAQEQTKFTKSSININRWIAIATVTAAVYYVLEIGNHFLGFYHH